MLDHFFKIRLITQTLILTLLAKTAAAQTLPKVVIDPLQVTVSGVSSGAFMAVQMHVAHSSIFSGVGSVAGGIYWCAEGDQAKSLVQCMRSPEQIDVERNIEKALGEAKSGNIDSLTHLQRARVYIQASSEDRVIHSKASVKLFEFYQSFVTQGHIRFESGPKSAHGFPTLDFGGECLNAASPWLLRCRFDTAGEILNTLYAGLKPRGTADAKNLVQFSQRGFSDPAAKLHQFGYLYVPDACLAGNVCRLHVALHGCQMSIDDIQTQFAEHSGYNEWAEANRIVVIYPQSIKSPGNPYGCWDWFGFTGTHYVNQRGPQIQAIKAMVDGLIQPAIRSR